MRLPILMATCLGLAAPALAQPASVPPAPTSIVSVPVASVSAPIALPAPDPVRLAIARRLVDKVVPPGTMGKMMEASLDAVTGNMVASFLPVAKQAELRGKDPAFDERLHRVVAVMAREMGAVIGEMEPRMRDAVAIVYARRFNERQLTDILAFYDTPTGTALAAQSLTLAADPDMMKVTLEMIPKLIQRMPEIQSKIKAATADLPPAPEPKK